MTPSNQHEGARSYAVRLTDRALADVDAAYTGFMEFAGQEVAETWRDGFYEAVAGLGLMPHRQVVSEAARFTQEVRQLLYRRRGSGVTHRVLFVVQEDGPDGPRVVILALRHGARGPITQTDAEEMEQDA